jgi:hypothetical protein
VAAEYSVPPCPWPGEIIPGRYGGALTRCCLRPHKRRADAARPKYAVPRWSPRPASAALNHDRCYEAERATIVAAGDRTCPAVARR